MNSQIINSGGHLKCTEVHNSYRGITLPSISHEFNLNGLIRFIVAHIYMSDEEKQLKPLRDIINEINDMLITLACLEAKQKLNDKLTELQQKEENTSEQCNFFSSIKRDISLVISGNDDAIKYVNQPRNIKCEKELTQVNIYKAIIKLIEAFTEIIKNEHIKKTTNLIKNPRFWEQVNEHFQKLLEAYF
jgi:DnaJ-domain-containing protein 1